MVQEGHQQGKYRSLQVQRVADASSTKLQFVSSSYVSIVVNLLYFVIQKHFQTPPESILLPITTHLVHFLNKRQPKLQARDAGIWWGTLGKLQLMLRKAAKVGKYFDLLCLS